MANCQYTQLQVGLTVMLFDSSSSPVTWRLHLSTQVSWTCPHVACLHVTCMHLTCLHVTCMHLTCLHVRLSGFICALHVLACLSSFTVVDSAVSDLCFDWLRAYLSAQLLIYIRRPWTHDQTAGVSHLCFLCAGVREADWSLVSGEHRFLSLHAWTVLSGQRGGPEGESQQSDLYIWCRFVTPHLEAGPEDLLTHHFSWCSVSSGSAVFPGGSDGGGEGGVPDETDGHWGGGGCIHPQITVLQQGTPEVHTCKLVAIFSLNQVIHMNL